MRKQKKRETEIRKKAVIYTRVSSKGQEEEGYSLDAQLKRGKAYATKNNMDVVAVFQDVESARSPGRTDFNNMINFLEKEAKKNRPLECCRIIICDTVDRLVRNMSDAGLLMFNLTVEQHFAREQKVISPESSAEDKYNYYMQIANATNYVDKLSENTISGMTQKAQDGMWPSGAPLGYLNVQNSDKKRVIIPDPDKAPLIVKIFTWYASGIYSLAEIATMACAAGFSFRKSGGKVPKSTVHKILTNPIYTGEFVWKDMKVKGKFQAIIAKDLFEKVQYVLRKKGQCPTSPQKHFFSFRGLLVCEHCGCAMVAEIKKSRYIYYHCTGNRGDCPGKKKNIREEILDSQFRSSIEDIQFNDDTLDWMANVYLSSKEQDRQYYLGMIASLEKQRVSCEQRIDNLYIDKLDGRISEDRYNTLEERFMNELNEINGKISSHKSSLQKYVDDSELLKELAKKSAYMYAKQSNEDKRLLLECVFQRSAVQGDQILPVLRKPFAFASRLFKSETASV
ncbi:recombinase family protein [bacterium]|nr:recombinase family protein [bacterium]